MTPPEPIDRINVGRRVFLGIATVGALGERAAIERIRRFPMKRALRVSKLPLAALEAT